MREAQAVNIDRRHCRRDSRACALLAVLGMAVRALRARGTGRGCGRRLGARGRAAAGRGARARGRRRRQVPGVANGTGKEVIVKGYDDEPYLRFLPNRVVEENTRSPSKYANEDRYALRPSRPRRTPRRRRNGRRSRATAPTAGSTTAST